MLFDILKIIHSIVREVFTISKYKNNRSFHSGALNSFPSTILVDEHTGLPNFTYGRRVLAQRMDEKKADMRSFVLLKITITNFPKILNSFGYTTGNKVINKTSERLKQHISGGNFLFSSYLDGWFVIYEGDNPQKIAEEIIEWIQRPLQINGQTFLLNCNIGISAYPDDGTTEEDLLKYVTIATSNATSLGTGKIGHYFPNQSEELLKRFQLANDLHQSITQSELYMEYQPKIDVKSLQVTGAEALIRWKHPVLGNISPGVFIPIAIETGFEEYITVFVIDETIRQLKQWEKDGVSHPCVSFNLAPHNLGNPHLYDLIKVTIEKYDVSPHHLEIEVTEDSMRTDRDKMKNTIERIQSLGIQFSLDDMGNGFASVKDLVHLKFDTLKIDRSLIDNLEDNEEQQIVLRNVLEMSKNLKIKSLVEGVERKGQLDLLKAFGCMEVQGFYFSPSVSGEEMGRWFRNNACPK